MRTRVRFSLRVPVAAYAVAPLRRFAATPLRRFAAVSLRGFAVCALTLLCLTPALLCPLSAFATQQNPAPADVIRDPASLSLLMDEAGLLTNDEAVALRQRLVELSDKFHADIVIVTVNSTGNATPMEFADDYFDYNGYGRGANKDGLLLLISLERDWWISTSGSAVYAFTDAGIQFIGDKMISNGLSSGDYARAFNAFVDWSDTFFQKADTGTPFDVGSLPKSLDDLIALVVFGAFSGFIVASLITGRLKAQLKTVHRKTQAADYILPGSFLVSHAHDEFLRRTVSSTPRPVASSSGSGGGGGSSTHTSSSGGSHGGGGGRF